MFPLIPAISFLAKKVVLPIVKKANGIEKGKTTATGLVVAAAGVALQAGSTHIVTDQNIVEILKAVAMIIEAIGTIVMGAGGQRHHEEEQRSTPSAS